MTDNAAIVDFGDWIGRQRTVEDVVSDRLVSEFRATLAPHLDDRDSLIAPLLIHWCLGPEAQPIEDLGDDGHPKKGDFLPPVPLPRRMWAAGELAFHDDLRVGDVVRRVSTIQSVTPKAGRTGSLWFVGVGHTIETRRGTAIEEKQTIVYREATAGAVAPTAMERDILKGDAPVDFSTVRLFRYSALTFNGHRIHYDAPYAREVEGYSGLVVHGPLQATLLAHLAHSRRGHIKTFSFRGVAPLIGPTQATMQITEEGPRLVCRMRDPVGAVTMEAWATA